jgi:hypothetical protein
VTSFRRSFVVPSVVAALVTAATLTACNASAESPAGLLVAASGSLYRLGDAGSVTPVPSAPANVRYVAVGGRSIAALTQEDRTLAATAASPMSDDLRWHPVGVTRPDSGFTAGIDLSPDGRSLALVRAHEDANRLELVVVDLATGDGSTRNVELGANGPPSWLGNDALALEVVDAEGTAKVVSVAAPGSDGDDEAPVESASRGLALSATPDGTTVAVSDDAAQSVEVTSRADWWSGKESGTTIEPPAADLAVHDIAIDQDATRVAVAYAHGDSPTWTLVVSRLVDGTWQRAASVDLESDVPPTIDWLE